jgi:S1-C subfamily serine protease
MSYRRLWGILAAALLTAPVFAQANAPAPSAADAGVLVVAVQPGSPAEKGGLARGDIILEANGKTVNDAADLRQAMDGVAAGATVSLKVRHGDAQRTLTLAVGTQNGRPWLGILPLAGRDGAFAFGGPGMRGGDDGFGYGTRGPGFGPGMRGYPGMFPGEGALVQSVTPASPAEKAGLKKGDLILSVDGTTVDQRNSLSGLVAARKVGDTVTLSVTSGQEEKTRDVKVTLAKNPDKEGAWLGLQYLAAPARFGGPGMGPGAFVAQVTADSPAAKAGIQARDVVTKIEGADVASPRQIVDAVAKHKPGDTLALTLVRRGDRTPKDVTVTLGKNPNDASKAWLGVSLAELGPGGFGGPGFGPGMRGPQAPDGAGQAARTL